MDTAFEFSQLTQFSPKQKCCIFDQIKDEVSADEEGYAIKIMTFCLTSWPVRADAIASITENYEALKQLQDETLETKLERDI